MVGENPRGGKIIEVQLVRPTEVCGKGRRQNSRVANFHQLLQPLADRLTKLPQLIIINPCRIPYLINYTHSTLTQTITCSFYISDGK